MNERDRQKRRALIAFQIFVYGYLIIQFGIQLHMSFTRGYWG
ncbi:hypothetical protein [Mycolicibacterium peregrinum]|jgi:hypothetical protein|nr:hypothetical protein [Mycolicibacterium peregrinum]